MIKHEVLKDELYKSWQDGAPGIANLSGLHELRTRGEREWGLDEEQGRPFIKRALELDINFFDTANMYGKGRSEEVLGLVLRDFGKRDETVIATKVYFPMRSD